ncbi:unnamed protein product, partial [Polarella glacialis]
MQRQVSQGGTIRHNVSTAQLLSDEEQSELRRWATRQQGPWTADLEQFPGVSGAEPASETGQETCRPMLFGYRCELFRNDYLAWCGSVQLPE